MASRIVWATASFFLLFLVGASVFSIYREGALFIPGLAPTVYKSGDVVTLKVNKVTSFHEPIPFRYHDLPVCPPPKAESATSEENIGSIVTGDRVENSAYELLFQTDEICKKLCSVPLNGDNVQRLVDLIQHEYRAQWQIDGLPVAVKVVSAQTHETRYETGFLLGNKGENSVSFNNHVHMIVHYHADKQNPSQFNVVLFEVQPRSIRYTSEETYKKECEQTDTPQQLLQADSKDGTKILYTYSIQWVESPVDWTQRWHNFRSLQGSGKIHWFSITNSLMIIFLLSALIAAILTKTIKQDFIRIQEDENEIDDETAWKSLHTEVFRAPEWPTALCVLFGSGVQILSMAVITMVFSVLGFLSPANQGSVLTGMIALYVWSGLFAGYASSRLYQLFKGERTMRNTLLTGFTFPGTIFGIAFVLNFFLAAKGSSGAFPAVTMLALFAMWSFVSVPLCYLGSRYAYSLEPPHVPSPPHQIPRPVPPQKWYSSTYFSILGGGVLPFGAIFIELSSIMSSIWFHKYYFLFGFLFLVFLILVITCAEMSIVMCYFQLCSLDWKWWWRSFLASGSSALYMFIYAIYYYTQLDVQGVVGTLLYFGYTLILCFGLFVLTGTIGLASSLYFVHKIYSAIHQD